MNIYNKMNSMIKNITTEEEMEEIDNLIGAYLFTLYDEMFLNETYKERKEMAKKIIIKREKLVNKTIKNKLEKNIITEDYIKEYREFSYKAKLIRGTIKEIKSKIVQLKRNIRIAEEMIFEYNMLGRIYFNNHFVESGRDYNEMANLKKTLRNVLLEDYVEFDITNTAYYMFLKMAKAIAKHFDTNSKEENLKDKLYKNLEKYLETRDDYIKIVGKELKVIMLRLFNSNETNKKRIITTYRKELKKKNIDKIIIETLIDLMEGIYKELKFIKYIISNYTFTFKSEYLTTFVNIKDMETVNDKNILSIFYMKLESIIIKDGKKELKNKNIDVIRIHDAIFYDANKKIQKEINNRLNKLLDFELIF